MSSLQEALAGDGVSFKSQLKFNQNQEKRAVGGGCGGADGYVWGI